MLKRRSEMRGLRSEVRGQRSEDRGWRMEYGDWMTEKGLRIFLFVVLRDFFVELHVILFTT